MEHTEADEGKICSRVPRQSVMQTKLYHTGQAQVLVEGKKPRKSNQ